MEFLCSKTNDEDYIVVTYNLIHIIFNLNIEL